MKEELSARLEDYLTVIYSLCQRKGVARSKEIRSELGVSGASVTGACQQLHRRHLIRYVPYEPIVMTDKGLAVAREVSHKKETLHAFFIEVLGVDQVTAKEGACKMEHAVSRDIIERMIKYTDFLRKENSKRCRHIRDYLAGTVSDP